MIVSGVTVQVGVRVEQAVTEKEALIPEEKSGTDLRMKNWNLMQRKL